MSDKVRMHDEVVDVIWKALNSYVATVASYIMTENVRQLWAWHCIFSGVDTLGLARVSPDKWTL